MTWFYCDDCGDTIKKAKVSSHGFSCSASSYTCIDCSRVFDRQSVGGHTQCVTEHEKYAQGATKRGGYAAQGFFEGEQAGSGQGGASPAGPAAAALVSEADAASFLSTRPPWACSVCAVTCTSEATLAGHALGARHQRRARAALATKAGTTGAGAGGEEARGEREEREEQTAEAPVRAAPPSQADAVEKSAAKKRARATPDAESMAGSGAVDLRKVKWKKLASRELEAAGGKGAFKAVFEAVLKRAELPAALDRAAKKEAKKLFKSAVASNGKFALQGGVLSVAAA